MTVTVNVRCRTPGEAVNGAIKINCYWDAIDRAGS